MNNVTMQAIHALKATTPTAPAQAQQEAFTAAMQQHQGASPEEGIFNALHQASTSFSRLTRPLDDLEAISQDPAKMLQAQWKISTTAVSIDLAAKLVGAVSQSINRLVSIQ